MSTQRKHKYLSIYARIDYNPVLEKIVIQVLKRAKKRLHRTEVVDKCLYYLDEFLRGEYPLDTWEGLGIPHKRNSESCIVCKLLDRLTGGKPKRIKSYRNYFWMVDKREGHKLTEFI